LNGSHVPNLDFFIESKLQWTVKKEISILLP
jgi:hypothetical protein